MKYGRRIAKLRENKGFTQEQMAQFLNISRASLSHYEKNRRRPDVETLKKMADLFQVSTDYLIGRKVNLNCTGWEVLPDLPEEEEGD
ncbi:HTH-type transcriptional regulator immR [Chlamydia abortus]|nr:HTH-type transcriptional regulator immR [Chlamydia abortus]